MGNQDRHKRISIVFSSKKIDEEYVQHIKDTCGVMEPDVIPIENDGLYSLSHAYNMGLEKAKHHIVVFVHDDVIYLTKNWGRKILRHFDRNPEYGIIGLAGTNNLISGMWWEDKSSMHGIVNHTDGKKTYFNTIDATPKLLILDFKLHTNYPNPFNPGTFIKFSVPNMNRINKHVRLLIYDTLGRKVRTLVDNNIEGGIHQIYWNGNNEAGIPVSSGIYFYELDSNRFREIRKMLLVR